MGSVWKAWIDPDTVEEGRLVPIFKDGDVTPLETIAQ